MENFRNTELNIPIAKVAEALGLRPGSVKDMYFSPMRDEKEASLHIDRNKNLWHDHGNGMGGTVAQLVMVARHCSKHEAYEFLRALDPSIAPEHLPQENDRPREIKSIRDIGCYYIKKYIADRKIPLELAKEYCKQITIYSPKKDANFTWLGFPNNSGGWALAHPHGWKSSTGADITTINSIGRISGPPTSSKVAVFEGFWDFLSWQVMQCSKKPTCDIVVLNSVNNIERAREYIGAHSNVGAFMDNDEAGRKCHARICEIMDKRGGKVMDMSELYKGHNDLNEFLQASRGYTANMSLTPRM